MDFDKLLLVILLSGIAYLAGYYNIAIIILLLGGLFFFAGIKSKPSQTVSAGGVKVHGADMLDPIIVETTKGPPFRIPKSSKMRINPGWGSLNLFEKATYKGAGSLAKTLHGLVFGRRND